MNKEYTRKEAKIKLNHFIENKLINYSKLRNFNYDNQNQLTTSFLSPYISHGILNETEIVIESLKKHSFLKCQKFIDEIFWRIYWRGWLELRPKLWSDYIVTLKKIQNEYKDNDKYIEALQGKTNIECFNDWVNELKEKNYLHNHVRMWFASIWIFTLNLPWQLGAAFFMKYLYDGDSASNTLSWRWVAGIQTVGKHYLAKEWNIKKFTNEKYKNIKVNEKALPIQNDKNYTIINRNFNNPEIIENKKLLIFENNLSFEFSDHFSSKFKKIFIVKNNNRKIELSKNVIDLKNQLIDDQINRLNKKSITCDLIDIKEINKINENVYALYPYIGENIDSINFKGKSQIKFLYRKIDQYSWQYCNKGFFNFKTNIPKIIKQFF